MLFTQEKEGEAGERTARYTDLAIFVPIISSSPRLEYSGDWLKISHNYTALLGIASLTLFFSSASALHLIPFFMT
jgi:hypothetical protein